jgi:hypothetical protein
MNSNEILTAIRQRQEQQETRLTEIIPDDQAENNIKYLNISNIKEVILNRNLCANEHTKIDPLPSAPLGESLRSGENESSVPQPKKPKLIMNTPDINYAKVSVQKPSKQNSKRRKINLDIIVKNSSDIKKLTFASTDKLDEYLRDIKRDYESGSITEQEYLWYVDKADFFKQLKADSGYRPIIGKGNRRGEKNTIRFTTAIFSGEHAHIWLGDWYHQFELEVPNTTRAQKYTDFISEYRDTRKPYVDMDWL